jgi:hypothetical protein
VFEEDGLPVLFGERLNACRRVGWKFNNLPTLGLASERTMHEFPHHIAEAFDPADRIASQPHADNVRYRPSPGRVEGAEAISDRMATRRMVRLFWAAVRLSVLASRCPLLHPGGM